jgi:hypothetical protein
VRQTLPQIYFVGHGHAAFRILRRHPNAIPSELGRTLGRHFVESYYACAGDLTEKGVTVSFRYEWRYPYCSETLQGAQLLCWEGNAFSKVMASAGWQNGVHSYCVESCRRQGRHVREVTHSARSWLSLA